MKHQPSHHGRTGPAIAVRPKDGVFAAVVVVPVAMIAILWIVQTPTATVGVAGFAVGTQAASGEILSPVTGAIPTDIRGTGAETDDPPTSTAKPMQ